MYISHIEIRNFRKLKSVRIDLSTETTLFVGANNSGKTSAMIALRHFLIDRGSLTTNDFTLSNWATINLIGVRWLSHQEEEILATATLDEWTPVLPSLDVWLAVRDDEVHLVRHLIPTLDWAGGALGVRLRLEPKDPAVLQTEFLAAIASAKAAKSGAANANGEKRDYTLSLWPGSMLEFLERKLRTHFSIRAYVLDPTKQVSPVNGVAQPQTLAADAIPLEGNPLDGLVVIHEIPAHRGMEDAWGKGLREGDGQPVQRARLKLSEQLRSYYSTHLDPTEEPESADIDALQAIEDAQKAFDDRLTAGFKAAIGELEDLNYPGFADPKLTISTRVRPLDGLNHQSAVRYEVACKSDGKSPQDALKLPEDYNGLGFQNLISMVFKLMSFRDSWLKVGKAGKQLAQEPSDTRVTHPPLHLVLVEEPEAHLHVQVQQVFVRKAYAVLRNHPDIRDGGSLHTQLVVSTHSSHVSHECQLDCLRYFRRVRPTATGEVPTSSVINLSEVFGPDDETARFVTRYLKSTHCELFFADAALLLEGAAERMLVPHFIQKKYPTLSHRFITQLEISGSHAHRFQPLIERLGLCTLVITDLDARDAKGGKAASPIRGANQVTGNPTLLQWHPKKDKVDELIAMTAAGKQTTLPDGQGCMRIAFQTPVAVVVASRDPEECLATTFEDALVLANLKLFAETEGAGMLKKVREAILAATDATSLCSTLFQIVRNGRKAEFALDLLWADKPLPPVDSMIPPAYIAEGLEWLEKLLQPEEIIVATDEEVTTT